MAKATPRLFFGVRISQLKLDARKAGADAAARHIEAGRLAPDGSESPLPKRESRKALPKR